MIIRRFALALVFTLISGGIAHADLELYLNSLDFSAHGNFGGYRAELGAHFGTSAPQLDLLFRTVDRPGDAAICLWLSRQSRQPLETVLNQYGSRKGRGWGELAQSLGIKPGSPAFKALKAGEIGWHPASPARPAGGKPRGDSPGYAQARKKQD
jgi:hypothetical protein